MIKKLLILFLFIGIAFSCKKDKEVDSDVTFLSGLIVNPELDYVIFSKGNQVLDTVPLDSKNFFFYKTDKITEEGLFIFRHNETQVFFAEPGDSLILHLNTMDFDKSLNYSGRGAEKNNLLMTLFLANVEENKNLPKWYTLSPEEFTEKIDSLKLNKEKEFKDFLSRNKEVSPAFKAVARTAINYDYYSKKELYGTANKNRLGDLGPDFYSYRDNIDFENEDLRLYYPYYRFMIRFFDNLVVSKHPFGINRNSYEFNIDRLHAIDSLTQGDSIRNSLTRITALRYFYHAKDEKNQEAFLAQFKQFNNNPRHIEEIEELSQYARKLSNGKTVPDVSLLTMENTNVMLHDVIKRPTVLYFWSSESSEQGRVIHRRAAELKSKYPEYDFIGINSDSHFRKWRTKVEQEKYDPKMEYQLENPVTSEKVFVLGNISKVIIIDTDKTILDGNNNMFNPEFEQLLLGYLNR